ncbi:MAG: NUDIX domain-containing protein [Planctomycetia bacterium]
MTPRQIAVAVVTHDGHVLVGRRAANAAEAAGFDEFPGGKIEPHESAAEAAARECLEEAGIVVRMLDRPCVSVSRQPPLRTIVFHWAAPLDATVPPRPPFEWIPIADLSQRKFPEPNAAVLAILRTDHAAHDHGGS